MTRTYPPKKYWGIDQSIRYGSSVRILDTTAGIVDTGTTLILLATGTPFMPLCLSYTGQ